RVWSPLANIPVLLKLENTAGGPTTEVSVNTTTSMQWETLEYDFSNDPAFNVANTYDRVVIFFDFGTEYNGSECETCDDGVQNGDEEGIDCGGSNENCVPCFGCTDPTAHNFNPNVITDDGSCMTCNDGIQNGDEEGVDCGGTNVECGPCGDFCINALEIQCGDVVSGDNNNNTADDLPANCGGVSAPAEGAWYVFEGIGGDVELSTDNAGTFLDTNIQVYSGDCDNLTCVGGNEDINTFNFQSEFAFNSTLGTDYYIYVSGWNGSQDIYELSIDCIAPLEIILEGLTRVRPPAATGSIDVTITGGCEPLTYAWTGPLGFTATTEDLTGLSAHGLYTLTVTDCLGNTEQMTFNVPRGGVRNRGRGRGGKTAFLDDAVFQASPNPFSQQTFISFNLTNEEQVSLNVYDITGKQVASLFNDTAKAETNYQFQFGNDLPTGTYIAALTTASGETKHIKLILTH
ncbi:MAG: T9SS type A sorting domain-containing protein, partial [Chitinophagales bacterium]